MLTHWLRNWLNPITASLTISRITSQDEQMTISFNARESDSLDDVILKNTFFGDVLHARMVHHNKIALAIADQIHGEAKAPIKQLEKKG